MEENTNSDMTQNDQGSTGEAGGMSQAGQDVTDESTVDDLEEEGDTK